MAARRRKTARPLLTAYLERVSGRTFENYRDLLREIVDREHGLYALYKGKRLYYVGLASDLRSRVDRHLKDGHAGRWDKFSLYLVRNSAHIKELETLLLRISDPVGNLHRGRLARADNLKPLLRQAMRERYLEEVEALLGSGRRPRQAGRAAARRRKGRTRGQGRTRKATARSDEFPLKGILARRAIYAAYKGREYTARVRNSGQIRFRGRLYDTPSAAAGAVTGRSTNGWSFWWANHKGELLRLTDLPGARRTRARP